MNDANKPMKILVIAGHPADMFDHCGGTLLHHIDRGDSVTCVTITQGLSVHDEVIYDLMRDGGAKNYTDEELAKICEERQRIKYAESIEACALFGITDVRFLNYDDEILLVTPEMTSKLADVIRKVHPDLVITHWPYQGSMFSNHHAVTGQLALAALNAASRVNFKTKDAAARVAQVAFMLCPADVRADCSIGTFNVAYANYYVEVTDVIDRKVKALQCMKSQKYNTSGYPIKTAEQWNGNFGAKISAAYAEGFALLSPEIGDTIPISPYRRWLANADEHELLERRGGLQAFDVKFDDE